MTAPTNRDRRNDLLALVDPDRDQVDADRWSRYVLPHANNGVRWEILDRLRSLARQIRALECGGHPLSIRCRGEDEDAHRTREINQLRERLDEAVGRAVEADGDAGRFTRYAAASVRVPRQRAGGAW